MPDRHAPRSDGDGPDFLDALLVGVSPAMRRLKALIPRVASGRSNVLIQGESGTGKELVARAIHLLSPRAAGAFLAENCAALPDGVVESELFGHVRGAFTGAERDRPGLIALADGGTLFLDEVGDLGARVQAKLLRVIQEGEYRPVGGREVRRSDFRVIAATHRDLAAMVEKGEFREDLYYRLNVVRIPIPPLRERVEDVPVLVEHVLGRLAGGNAPGPVRAGVSKEAMEMLLRYPWPGNVRELQNVLEAGLVMATEGVIGVGELPERVIDFSLAEPARGEGDGGRAGSGDGPEAGVFKPAERVMIETALSRFSGDKTKAARFIGWSRPKLYRQMARYGIVRDFGKEGA
jgi:two-component system NtrC family response regulator